MRWDTLSYTAIQGVCRATAEEHPDWHADLTAMDLGKYLAAVPQRKRWWLLNTPTSEEPSDGKSYLIES